MRPTRRTGALAALLLGLAILLLTAPLVALATTGTGVTRRFQVTLSDKGAAWKPALRTLDPIVGARLRVTVVNGASQPHWFRVGSRQTKVLTKGQKAVFFVPFTKLGKLPWTTGVGNVRAAAYRGVIHVRLPTHFG
jgi:hypothetical protein